MRYTGRMAWRRVRRRGWLCWVGIGACAAIAALCCLTPRTHWFTFADSGRGGDWTVEAQTQSGRLVLSYRFRPAVVVSSLFFTPIKLHREDERFENPLTMPDMSFEDRRGHLGVPIWLLAMGVAVLGLIPMMPRRKRTGFHRARTVGGGIAVLSLTIAGISPFMDGLWGMHRLVRVGSSIYGWGSNSSGLSLWRADEASPIEDEGTRVRWYRQIPLEILADRAASVWRPLTWRRAGIPGAFLAELRTLGGFCVFNGAFVSWWMAGVVVGVPTLAACWRSRRVAARTACSECGYDLSRLRSAGCPECGAGRV